MFKWFWTIFSLGAPDVKNQPQANVSLSYDIIAIWSNLPTTTLKFSTFELFNLLNAVVWFVFTLFSQDMGRFYSGSFEKNTWILIELSNIVALTEVPAYFHFQNRVVSAYQMPAQPSYPLTWNFRDTLISRYKKKKATMSVANITWREIKVTYIVSIIKKERVLLPQKRL